MVRRCGALLAIGLASCKGCEHPSDVLIDAAPPPVLEASASLPADAGAGAESGIDAAPPELPMLGDAGTSSCRLVYGPAEQTFRGPAALAVAGQELQLIANDSGKPHVYSLPIPPIPAKGAIVPPRPTSFVGMRWPPCEAAGKYVYCQGPGGTIVRSRIDGRDSKEIAKGRSGTRIAAAALGPDHSVVAFLDQKHTTEGFMLQAFVALDENEPVRLSDDGAGATTLRFLPHPETPVAVYLDTRTSMVPIHARPVGRRGTDLSLGTDSVLFVGGAPERGIDFTVVAAGKSAFALVPMSKDTLEFGMAALPIADPPKDNVEAAWSTYPNGIDPAPIAAAPSRDGKGAWIARVRPREKAVGSPRILELGRIDESARYTSLGELEPGKGITDIGLIEDPAGTVWLVYGDATITWLERRSCR